MRIGKFFSNCAKNKKIHDFDYRNRYATAFTPHNRNCATATVMATATAFQNLDTMDMHTRKSRVHVSSNQNLRILKSSLMERLLLKWKKELGHDLHLVVTQYHVKMLHKSWNSQK
ncbi:hypothetical protein HYC85_027787 [Camellia sinensis]|uniref:Uncharacterized protein n=1 Tax=Camellia sinensis TaxID=4442 RepID=A0A7J7FXA2_CAMSI|nr:hypothetical protein HYC85_027787 [Camellia sinensis]